LALLASWRFNSLVLKQPINLAGNPVGLVAPANRDVE
jgi:hypothetical protein